jgi:uridylate kinase
LADPVFKRILLKLSGESLMGSRDYGTDPERIRAVAGAIKRVHDRGIEIAIVVGAGNIYRGMKGAAAGMDRATADYMGMLATVLNALPLQDALEAQGVNTRVQSAIKVEEVAEPYIRRRAMRHLENGVEGVYTADPREDSEAMLILEITHMEALQRGLRVMDATALTLCMENRLPIHVFNMDDEQNIERIVSGERVGTLVKPEAGEAS